MIFGMVLSISAMNSFCWDGVVTGTVAQISAVGSGEGAPGNYDIRVYLVGVSTICNGAANSGWAYINANDANFKGILSILELAVATGKTVSVYTNVVAQGCQIGYVSINS